MLLVVISFREKGSVYPTPTEEGEDLLLGKDIVTFWEGIFPPPPFAVSVGGGLPDIIFPSVEVL